jgi:EAL domain-containing protein (putative c-di-GMP-specific phosphodiesterase class I)
LEGTFMQLVARAYPEVQHLPASLEEIQHAIAVVVGRAYGYFNETIIDSAFQPIYSVPHRRIVGHEGLLRASTAQECRPISPLDLLASTENESQSVFLDRLCRTIHMHNYQVEKTENLWLFLNVSAQVINRRRDHEPFFADLLAQYQVAPQQVVIEIVEGVIPDFTLLTEAVQFYREAGCIVAIDDFGAEASDLERIWRVSPDIVKLDRKIIAAAEFNHKARRVLKATVALIHEAGSLALLEGVETAAQAAIALDSNADLLQGYYFARPDPIPLLLGDGGLGELAGDHPPALRDGMQHQSLQPYVLEFKCALLRLASGQGLKAACSALIALGRIDNCYITDGEGRQIGATLRPPNAGQITRFMPLADVRGANWAHKPYHYRAMAQPGELQISHPYLSITSSRLCITLSATFQYGGQTRVLCCDVEWLEEGARL